MATSIDTLISNAQARAQTYASVVDLLVTELRQFVADQGNSAITLGPLDITQFQPNPYVSPTKDLTPTPVYEPPLSALPTAPLLADPGAVSIPAERIAPTINTSSLFQQIAPSSNLPDFNEAEPDLLVDSLVAELSALAAPTISQFAFPEISSLNIGAAPTLTIPGFDAYPTPDAIRDPIDYGVKFDNAYHQMAPEMQAFIDDKISTWVSNYAPEYSIWVGQVSSKISSAFEGGVLPDQFEAAMYTRARGRIEREVESAKEATMISFSKSGFMEPPGTITSALLTARLKGITSLADQSTDIYIERKKTEVQHLQFALNIASAQIASIRNIAISYSQIVAGTMQTALGYAKELVSASEKIFEHLIARAQLSVSIMAALNAQYEIKLKAALAALDGYKLSLEAEKLKADVEVAKIQVIEAQIKAEDLSVRRYSALIDAIVRKGSLEELKLKGYSIRADIFKAQTQAKVAGFEIYKAGIEGDQAKLEGELAKLKIYDSQLHSDTIRLDAQVKQIEAVSASNAAKVKIFESGAEVYKLDIETALTKFNAQAEVKKLAQSIYGQELVNAIEEFKAGVEIPKLMIEAVLKQYQVTSEAAIESAKLAVERLKVAEHASVAATRAYEAMASAALGSLNTMASSAISAVA
jgi:hypothetical protein